MSALADRIAAKHQRIFNARYGLGPHCTCGWIHRDFNGSQKHVTHVAAVTEAAVREHIAAALDDLARVHHDDLKKTKHRTRAETFAGASAMAYELAARIARGEQ